MIESDGLHIPDGYYIPRGKYYKMCCQCHQHEVVDVERVENAHSCVWVPVAEYTERGWNLERTEHQPDR